MRELTLGGGLEDCGQKGLLPASVAEAMEMAYFIAGVVELAQRAHCLSGVPASVLISHHAFRKRLGNSGTPGWRRGTYFFQLASRLAKNRSFQPVVKASGNQDALVEALLACTIWERQSDRENVVSPIVQFHLAECDACGNKYRADSVARKTKRTSASQSTKGQPILMDLPVKAPTAAVAPFMRKKQGAKMPSEIGKG